MIFDPMFIKTLLFLLMSTTCSWSLTNFLKHPVCMHTCLQRENHATRKCIRIRRQCTRKPATCAPRPVMYTFQRTWLPRVRIFASQWLWNRAFFPVLSPFRRRTHPLYPRNPHSRPGWISPWNRGWSIISFRRNHRTLKSIFEISSVYQR